jgi:nickel/cobalt transporter (NicO) family protein
VASALPIIATALWMLGRTWRKQLRLRGAAPQHATGQIVVFGLSGGLIPCSAAITVLVLCLQVNQIWLGVALVLRFSIGLAITLIAAGMTAAIGMHHFSRRWPGFGELAERVPYLSGILMIGLGLYFGLQGWLSIPAIL